MNFERDPRRYAITEGASEAGGKWTRLWKSRVLREWPPTSDEKYDILEKNDLDTRIAELFRHRGPVLLPISTDDDSSSSDSGTSKWSGGLVQDGDVDSPGDARLRAQWLELADNKARILNIRSDIENAQACVDRARLKQSIAMNDFISNARMISAHQVMNFSSIQEQLDRFQTAQEDCDAQEVSLQALEDTLKVAQDEQDFLLRRLILVLRSFHKYQFLNACPFGIIERLPPALEVLLDQTIEPASVSLPLYQNLKIKVHALREALDHQHELLGRKREIESQQRRFDFFQRKHPERLHVIAPPQDVDLHFLRNFEQEAKAASERTEACRCQTKEVVSRFLDSKMQPPYVPLPLDEIQKIYPYASTADLDVDLDLGTRMETDDCFPSDFSLLRSNHTHLFAPFPLTAGSALENATKLPDSYQMKRPAVYNASKEASIENLVTSAYSRRSVTDFTNGWLLYQLRTSRHQMYMLYSSIDRQTAVEDLNKWQQDVLDNWSVKDEAEIAREARKVKQPSITPHGSFTSWLSLSEDPPSPPSWYSEPCEDNADVDPVRSLRPFRLDSDGELSGLRSMVSDDGEKEVATAGRNADNLSSPHSPSERLLSVTPTSPSAMKGNMVAVFE